MNYNSGNNVKCTTRQEYYFACIYTLHKNLACVKTRLAQESLYETVGYTWYAICVQFIQDKNLKFSKCNLKA